MTHVSSIALLTAALCSLNAKVALPEPASARVTDVVPELPVIPDRRIPITDFAPAADGKADDTPAFVKALKQLEAQGGGHLIVASDKTYLIGPIHLPSNTDLHLEKGAVLLVRNDMDTFPMEGSRYHNIITAGGAQNPGHDISITGEGTIDGQGSPWWARYRKPAAGEAPDPKAIAHRPHLIVFDRCIRVLIEGIHLKNSPNFHFVPQDCDDLTMRDVTITAPERAPNTDALDPSGQRQFFTRLTIDVGDDNFAFKPGKRRPDGSPACQHILITDCTFKHGHGLSIGGQTPGGLENLTVRNCTFENTDAGIRMKANRGAGGLVQNCVYENLTMKNVKVPIFITSYYPTIPKDILSDAAQPADARTPYWRNIILRNITITESPEAGRILGLAEARIADVRLENVQIEARTGLRVVRADGVVMKGCSVKVEKGDRVLAEDAEVREEP